MKNSWENTGSYEDVQEYSGYGYTIYYSRKKNKIIYRLKNLSEVISGKKAILLSGKGALTVRALLKLKESNIQIIVLPERKPILDLDAENIKLLKAQVEAYLNYSKRLHYAKQFILSASYNRLTILRKLDVPPKELSEAEDKILDEISEVFEAKSIQELMSHEAAIAKTYYDALKTIIPEEYEFEKRTRMPPTDPVSAAISYFNIAILYPTCSMALRTYKLNPYIGYLHEIQYNRESLTLDFAEQFRQPLIEEPIISLFRNKLITPQRDYKQLEDNTIKLTKRGKTKIRRAIRQKLYATVEKERRLIDIIYSQAKSLADSLLNRKPYRPYRYKPLI